MGKTLTATPANWYQTIVEATKGGVDTVKFEGEFPRVTIYNIAPPEIVELDLTNAHIVSYATSNTRNWRHYRGLFSGYIYTQAQIQGSADLEFDHCTFNMTTTGNCGLGCARNCEKIHVHDCLFEGGNADGADFSSCHKVRVEDCRFQNMRTSDTLHSDCCQLWQEDGFWALEDIAFHRNTAVVNSQGWGIYAGDHSIAGISLVGNTIASIAAHAGHFNNILPPPQRNSNEGKAFWCVNECRDNKAYTAVGCPKGWACGHWTFESKVGAPLDIENNLQGVNGIG